MDNKILICFAMMILLLGSVSAVELNPFATTKDFKTEITEDMSDFIKADFNSKYGVIRLDKDKFWFWSDRVAEYSLIENTEQCLINCEARGKATLYVDGTLFDDTIFKTTHGDQINISSKYFLKGSEEYIEETPVYKEICEDLVDAKNGTTSKSCSNELVETLKETKTRDVWNVYNGEILKAGDYEWKIEGKKPTQAVDFIPIKSEKEFSEWAWWNSSWSYKKQINITGGESTLYNFTVWVPVTYNSNMNEDYGDIRFVDSTETTEYSYERDYYNSTDAGFWILFPTLTTGNNPIYMYYNNSESTTTSNGATTWANYELVYHFSEGTGTATSDSLGANNGVLSSTAWINTTFGGGVYTNGGTTGYIESTATLPIGGNNISSVSWITSNNDSASPTFLTWGPDASGKRQFFYCDSTYKNSGYSNDWNTGVACSTTNDLKYHTIVKNATGIAWYINGVKIAVNGAYTSNNVPASKLYITNSAGRNAERPTGITDEIRVYLGQLTDNYIARDYQNSNSSYVTFGEEELISGISISLISPENNLLTNSQTIDFNATITPTTVSITNVTFYVGDEVDFQSYNTDEELNLSWTKTLDDGSYSWNVTACGSNDKCSDSITRSFEIDSTLPNVEIINATDLLTLSLPINSSINISATDLNLDSCWYYTSDNSTNTTATCNDYFNLEWTTGGTKTIYAFANDSAGNENSTTDSLNVYDFNYTQTGSASAGEGTSQTFTLLVNSTSFPIGDASANLWYDGADVGVTSKTAVGTNGYLFSKTISIPTGTGNSTGKDVNWLWNYNTTQLTTRNTTTQTQTVYNMSISDCEITSGRVILNMSLKDEQLNSLVNTTTPNTANIEIDLTISSLINSSQTWDFSKQWSQNQSVAICVPDEILNYSSYRIDFIVGYDTSSHVREFFYMDNGTLDNTDYFNSYTDNTLNLLDLAIADSTTFLFEYTDENNQEVNEIIVHTFRKYIGEGLFREIERSKQDNAGQTHMHLVEEDVIYYFMITQYGNILFTSDEYNAKCLSSPCTITLSASAVETNWSIIDNEGGQYSVSTDKSTRIVTTSFNLDSIGTVNSTIYRFYEGEAILINSSTLTSTSGSIDLFIPLSYDNSSFFVAIFNDGEFVKSQWVSLTESARDYFGVTGAILGGLIIVAIMFMAITEGAGFIIFTIFALIIVTIMQLVDLSWLAIISIISAGAIIVWKLINRRGSRQ